MAPAELALPGAWPEPQEGPDMDNRTSAEPSPRGDLSWLADYRPQRLDETTWTAIRPFVIECVEALGLEAGPSTLRTLRVLSLLAAWSVAEGLPLDVEAVLDPDTASASATLGVQVASRPQRIGRCCAESDLG